MLFVRAIIYIIWALLPLLTLPSLRLIWKDPDAGKDWGQEENRTTEDEIVGWHHWFNGHEFGKTLGVGDGRGGLACCDSWGRKESGTTEWLNWTELNWTEWLVMVSMFSCAYWPFVCSRFWRNVCSCPLPISETGCLFCCTFIWVNDDEYLLRCWFAMYSSSLKNCLNFWPFLTGSFCYCWVLGALYVFWILVFLR